MVISTSWDVSEVSVVIETIDKIFLTSFLPSVLTFYKACRESSGDAVLFLRSLQRDV